MPDQVVVLRARMAVLLVLGGSIGMLQAGGVTATSAVIIAGAGTTGGIAVGVRLTQPYNAPLAAVSALSVIAMVINGMVLLGTPPTEALATVLVASWCIAGVARQVTTEPAVPLGLSVFRSLSEFR